MFHKVQESNYSERTYEWLRRCLLPLVAVAVAAISTTVFAQGPDDYYDSSERARKHLSLVDSFHTEPAIRQLNAGQLKQAEDNLDYVLRHFPNHPKGLYLFGELALKSPRLQVVAEMHFRRAIQDYPAPSNHLVYGIYLHKSSKLDKAIEQYKIALAARPDYAEAHYNLGLAYVDIKNYDLAYSHAMNAYRLGYRMPGLKRKLEQVGAWKSGEQ